MKNILSRFGNRNDKNKTAEQPALPAPTVGLEIVFYKDNGTQGYHGTLYADHVHMENKKNEIVSFFFKDVHPVPAMTPEMLAYIFDQAKTYGWVPKSLRSYATVFTVMPQPQSAVKLKPSPSVPSTPSA